MAMACPSHIGQWQNVNGASEGNTQMEGNYGWSGVDAIPPSSPVYRAILDARWILRLGKDWDGEGSPAFSRATFDAVVSVLTSLTLSLKKKFGLDLDSPVISPGPNGSIDVHWERRDLSLIHISEP